MTAAVGNPVGQKRCWGERDPQQKAEAGPQLVEVTSCVCGVCSRLIKTLEQTKAIEDLSKSRDKLEKMKEKAEKKLLTVQSELDTTEHEAKESNERSRNMLEVVTSEMKTLKKSLEEAEKREKQLMDFREVVSQMLGLNMTGLALPDYEVIKCLERLIHSHQHHFVSCACLKDVTSRQDRHPQGHLQLLH
ncbi:hypothetical protein CB1_000812041 [Camelus ferus]|nr:hypothetical protein CB1_000812041 [Camelus ferus]